MKRILFIFVGLCWMFYAVAQDQVLDPNIKTIMLYRFGDQLSFPVIGLGSAEGLELHFDDLDNHIKNYYYTFQLCNADWSPTVLHPFEYIRGFDNVRITTYRNSSLSTTRYIHYQANVPDRNCY